MDWKLALKVNKFIHEECVNGVPHDIGANVMNLIESELNLEYITVMTISDSIRFISMAENQSQEWFEYSKFRSDIKADENSYYEGYLKGISQCFSIEMEKSIKEISENKIINHAIRFSLKTCPQDEKGELLDFDKRKKTFYSCVKWFVENYSPIVYDESKK